MERERPEPSESEILAALASTGFLFEQNVAQIFAGHPFGDVEVGHSFEDPDTGKSREVDVLAAYEKYVGDWRLDAPMVQGIAIAECKNTASPFVLIGSNGKISIPTTSFYASSFDPLNLGYDRLISTPNHLNFYKLPGNPYENEFYGTQLVRMNLQHGTWKADNGGVFDSIVYPLAKAVRNQQAYFSDEEPFTSEAPPGSPSFAYFYPLLVTSGPVYCVCVDSRSSTVKRVKWAKLVRHISERNLRGMHFVDVVQFQHLDEYISVRIIGFLAHVERKIAENARYFDPEWLMGQHGRPRKDQIFEIWRQEMRQRRGLTS